MNADLRSVARGVVASVRGSVVDVRFDEGLPSIYSVLRAGNEGEIAIEVLSQRDAHHVRGIALTPTQGLARGAMVNDTGAQLQVPLPQRYLDMTPAFKRCSDGTLYFAEDPHWTSRGHKVAADTLQIFLKQHGLLSDR